MRLWARPRPRRQLRRQPPPLRWALPSKVEIFQLFVSTSFKTLIFSEFLVSTSIKTLKFSDVSLPALKDRQIHYSLRYNKPQKQRVTITFTHKHCYVFPQNVIPWRDSNPNLPGTGQMRGLLCHATRAH
jgi:hypothetical protein